MRRQKHHNVFTAEFLQHLESHYQESPTEFEAVHAGPWHVREIGERRFAVHREAEPREDLPEAIFIHRETALLAAALLPWLGRTNPYRLCLKLSELGFEVQAILGGRLTAFGWLKHPHPEVLEALHLGEAFLRSPKALARLLEAANHGTLRRVGQIVARDTER